MAYNRYGELIGLQSQPAATSWQDKLKSYSTDRGSAIQELMRAKNVYGQEQALGAGQDRLNQISRWASQVRQAGGLSDSQYGSGVSGQQAERNYGNYQNQQQQKNYQTQTQNMLSQLQKKVNTPFSYDPENDPRYKAAQQLAESQARTAGNQAMEALNDRGILNSTITSDRLGQIGKQYSDSVLQMVPQLYQNAYQEYQGGINNMSAMLNALANQENTLYGRVAQQDQSDAAASQWGQEYDLKKALQDAQIQNYADDMQYKYAALDAENRNSLNDLAYRYSALNSKSDGYDDKNAQEEGLQLMLAQSEFYSTGNDYLADVRRNKSELLKMLGTDGYTKLEKYALSMSDDTEGWSGTKFKKGSSSPIGQRLKEIMVNPNAPTSSKTGISSDIVSVVNNVASRYDVDPALILAIGQHETGWGKLGDGRKGMYTGYGSYDSGSDYGYAGLEKQVEGTAKKMRAWGMSRGNVSLERLKTGNSGKLPTGIYATDKNWPNAIWKYYQKYR